MNKSFALFIFASTTIFQPVYAQNFFSRIWSILIKRPTNFSIALPSIKHVQAIKPVYSGQVVAGRHMDLARQLTASFHRGEISREELEQFFELSHEEKDALIEEAKIFRLWQAFRGFQF